MNLVILSGFTGDAAELKYTQDGQAIMSVSLATTEKWKTGSGEAKERTEWHRLSLFGKRAEALAKHIEKGIRLNVTGQIQYRSYDDKEGIKRYITEIKIKDLEFANGGGGGSKGKSRSNGGGQSDYGQDESAGGYDDSNIPF